MSLRDEVFEAAGGDRWTALRHFTSHLMLGGALVAPLQGPHSLKEIVAECDLVNRSIRMSGFSDAGAAWGFYPDFVTIRHDDGAFVGSRREAAPRAFRYPKDEAELVYLCGLSIWSCMTAPLAMLGGDARTVELSAWSERGETWRRLWVRAPEGALSYAREAVMYFGCDGLLKRTDFDIVCGDAVRLIAYASAHHSFSGLTVPTLYRAVRRTSSGAALERRPVLDIEIFDVVFD
jgi:hypothetical protein